MAFDYLSGGQSGFGHKQIALSVAGLGAIAWGADLWNSSGWPEIRARLLALRGMPLARIGSLAFVTAQLGLVIYVMREMRIENLKLWDTVAIMAGLGFVVNLVIP